MSRERNRQRISKTRRKEGSAALQSLGESLIGLPPDQLDQLELPADLREALELAGRLTKHGAQRRQRQYIGRLMRELDPAPIRAYLEERQIALRRERDRFRRIEHWRDRLLGDDAAVLEECATATGADIGRLRELRHTGRQAHSAAARKTASRGLFRYLHTVEHDREDAERQPQDTS